MVERPASVVKELLENAIDAGATRVDVAVERGGKDLIRVADNGRGMDPDDLPLAFTPHATSKLADADDLDGSFADGQVVDVGNFEVSNAGLQHDFFQFGRNDLRLGGQ